MWLNDPAAVAAFRAAHAQSELLEATGYAPTVVDRLQREKLALLWGRARSIPGFATLPGFAECDFDRLPVTPKDAVKADPGAYERTDRVGALKYYESSGSSGRTTPTPRTAGDLIANAISVAGLWRRCLGAEPRRVAALLPSDVLPVCDLVAATTEYLGHTLLRCYPFTLGVCDWDRLSELFLSYRPDAVFAAPGVMVQWTRLLKARGALREVSASVQTVLLLGEVSLPGQRRKLGLDWDAVVLDASYGSTETGTIAAACPAGQLHLLTPAQLLEVRTEDSLLPAAPGLGGELVTTTLNNHARPLLRYGTGDLVQIGAQPCSCGLALATVEIQGRGTDSVAWRGVRLTERLLGSVVYDDPRLTGYLVQLRADDSGARLVLERDVDAEADADIIAGTRVRCAAAGLRFDDVVVVSQLPVTSKSGGSQKNWKRTNVARVAA
jgi:phenylacetate-CoA ligase